MVLLGEKFITVSARDYAIAVRVEKRVEDANGPRRKNRLQLVKGTQYRVKQVDEEYAVKPASETSFANRGAGGDDYTAMTDFDYRCFYTTILYEGEPTEVFRCQLLFSYPIEGLLRVFVGRVPSDVGRKGRQAVYLKDIHDAVLYLQEFFTIEPSQLDCHKTKIIISCGACLGGLTPLAEGVLRGPQQRGAGVAVRPVRQPAEHHGTHLLLL